MPESRPLLTGKWGFRVTSLHKHEVAHTKRTPRKARNGCLQSPHHVPGTVLHTIDTDSFNPHDNPSGGFLHGPFRTQEPNIAPTSCLHSTPPPRVRKKPTDLRGREKVGKSYLGGSQVRKKKRTMCSWRPREGPRVGTLTRIMGRSNWQSSRW